VPPTDLRFAANISILYGHLPLLTRPAAAAADGFTAVESWWPFSTPVPDDKEADQFAGALVDAGVQLVAMNLPEGDMRAGDRGLLSSPGRAAQFRASLPGAAEFARRTRCRILNALYGNREPGADRAEQDEIAYESLRLAVDAARAAGARIVLEAISAREAPNYPLKNAPAAVAALSAAELAGVSGLGLLCDLYHHGANGEDLAALITKHAGLIAHVQVADTPGRGRPGSGILDYPAAFAALAANGYDGWIGLEYEATRDPTVDYDWMPAVTGRGR